MSTTETQPRIAPDDPGWYLDDVETAYAWLRENDPIHHYEPADLYLVSKHADIRAVGSDPETFCSSRGILVNDTIRGSQWDRAPSIIYMDPPEHRTYRKLVTYAFSPRMLKALEGRIRELARDLVTAIEPGEVFNFVDEVAVPLPVLVIAEMLGVPREDRDQFRRWSDDAILAADEGQGPGMAEFAGYLVEHLKRHAENPTDDILTRLVQAEVDGQRLSADEIVIMCVTLLVAGNETTRNLIAGGTRALAEHPDQRDLLAAEPERIPNAVEEMLRWVTPVKTFARTATRDAEVRGTPIPEGAYLVFLYASGNRDEEVWGSTADRFDVTRPLEQHVAFGFGEHYCLGANLARIEARILFEELLAHHPRFGLAGEPQRLRSTLMNGLTDLPIRVG